MSATNARTAPDIAKLTEIAKVFELAGSPVRLEIVRRLAEAQEPLAARELAAGQTPTAHVVTLYISHLRASGLVEGRRDGRRHVYSLAWIPMTPLLTNTFRPLAA